MTTVDFSSDKAVTRPLAQWPLAGSAEFARIDPNWRESLARRFASDLQTHVVEPWFPRCVDREAGGFLCDFDHRWRPRGAQRRMLEFQARQTRTAARLGLALRDDQRWTQIARHGLRYLRDVMRDGEHGGLYCFVDRSGAPLAAGTKHAHGTAYTIDACVAVYRLTRDDDALALARETFEWLESALHDDDHGGYFGWATRAGRPILHDSDAPALEFAARSEPLGHGVGLKDANVHSDLLEALTLLHGIWPDQRVLARLAEVYAIMTTRIGTRAGEMHYVVHSDFTPVPGIERYGYPLQTASRLAAAAAVLGVPREAAHDAARAAIDHVLEWGWDDARGSFVEAGPASEPTTLSGMPLRSRIRPWWVQTEAVKALLTATLSFADGTRYQPALDAVVGTIGREFVDRRRRGWRAYPPGDFAWYRRLTPDRVPKGDMWKDASHEADMYLTGVRMLRGLDSLAPIRGSAAET